MASCIAISRQLVRVYVVARLVPVDNNVIQKSNTGIDRELTEADEVLEAARRR